MFELSMDGAWPLTVEIESPALGRASLSLDMATSRKGLKLTGATPAEGTAAPLPATEPGAGTLVVDEGRRQRIGLTVGTVERAPMQRTIRAVGRVAYDETRLRDVTLKFDAWIGELHANAVGIAVTKDRPLFTVYGPDLLIAQKDLLLARRSMRQGRRAAAGDGEGGAEADTVLVEASRQRLLLMDIAPELVRDIEAVARSRDYLPILAPVTGTVIEKNVVAGAAMKKGDRLLRIADLSRVWVKAQVYEADLPFLRRGMPAAIALTHLAGIERAATVTYIYPYLTGESRTGRIRLELDNADGALKPDMFADVRLIADLGSRLRVPDEAVLYAGDSRIVFVDLGGGRLQPRKVRTGARDGGFVEIVEGVAEGERIVTSANFLIASESRLKAAVKQW
jgi:Cu(I)/Ag(I) efflux system membrane fusion protein